MQILIIDQVNENAGKLLAILNSLGYKDVWIESRLGKITELYKRQSVDLVFVKIGLWIPEMIGLHRSLQKKPVVVFTAGERQRGYGGLGLAVPFYLPARFKSTDVERLLLKIAGNPGLTNEVWDHMLIRCDAVFLSIPFAQITKIVARGSYITINVRQGKSYIIFLSLARLMRMLPTDLFCRINRSTILSLMGIPVEYKRCWVNRGQMICINDSGGAEVYKRQRRRGIADC